MNYTYKFQPRTYCISKIRFRTYILNYSSTVEKSNLIKIS